MNLCRWSAATSGLPTQELGDHHEIVGQHGGTDEQFEMRGTLDQGALHAAPTKQYRDAAFDAGAEALPLLERPAFFKRFPFGASLASRLRDAGEGDAGCPAGLKVLFVKEAAIGTIQMRHGMKDGFVAV
jgi:hypothetical protein